MILKEEFINEVKRKSQSIIGNDNDLLFTIREYAGDIVKIEVATKTEYYRYIARN